jgi:hypothetical protein
MGCGGRKLVLVFVVFSGCLIDTNGDEADEGAHVDGEQGEGHVCPDHPAERSFEHVIGLHIQEAEEIRTTPYLEARRLPQKAEKATMARERRKGFRASIRRGTIERVGMDVKRSLFGYMISISEHGFLVWRTRRV